MVDWGAVVGLQQRGDRETFDEAARLLGAPDVESRLLGALVLRELGPPVPAPVMPFRAETVPLLAGQLTHETDPLVTFYLISGLGYHDAKEYVPLILRFETAESAQVRFGLAAALPGLTTGAGDEPVVAALIRLARDPEDADIRWYALTGLEEIEVPAADIDELPAERRADPDRQIQYLACAYGLLAWG